MPVWFSGQWTVPSILNMTFFVFWITAATFMYTWIFNNTKGSVLMAILAQASMDTFPNAILWPLFPAATKLTDYGFLYGYLGLIIGFGVSSIVADLFDAWPAALPTLPIKKRELTAASALIPRTRFPVMPSLSALSDIRPKKDVTSEDFAINSNPNRYRRSARGGGQS